MSTKYKHQKKKQQNREKKNETAKQKILVNWHQIKLIRNFLVIQQQFFCFRILKLVTVKEQKQIMEI